jgi:Rod binding domain-containing protein
MSLPPIDTSLLPADIRNGSTDRKKTYEAALGFERMLLQQLTKSLADTAKPIDGGDDSSADSTDAASETYKSMLPGTLADSVISAGGLGLARSLVPQEEAK